MVSYVCRQKIAFVDYEDEEKARIAMNSTRQFRFPDSTKGLSKLLLEVC